MKNDIDKLLNSFFLGGKAVGGCRGGTPSQETIERVRRQMERLERQTNEDIVRTGEEVQRLETETSEENDNLEAEGIIFPP